MKDIWLGILGVLHAGWELTRDYAKQYWAGWKMIDRKYRCSVYAVMAVLLLSTQCASAENAPASNFGLIGTPDGIVYGCYVSDGKSTEFAGNVYTCMIFQVVDTALVYTGAVTYCAQDGVHENGQSSFTCGEYADMRSIASGI